MNFRIIFNLLLGVGLVMLSSLLSPFSVAAEPLRVVATLPDLKYLVEQVGGNHVQVEVLAKPSQDFHFVDPKPSFVVKLSKADLVVANGLSIEIGWLPSLINNARNPRIMKGAKGYLEPYAGIDLLEVKRGKVDRSMGDVHPEGNPHYLLDPVQLKTVAANIAKRLASLLPQHEATFMNNLNEFKRDVDKTMAASREKYQTVKGLKVITYHNSWPYLARRFHLKVAAFVEPKPGISPSPAWIQELIKKIRAEKIRVLITESYQSRHVPDLLARETGIQVVTLAHSSGEFGLKTPLAVVEDNLRKIQEAANR